MRGAPSSLARKARPRVQAKMDATGLVDVGFPFWCCRQCLVTVPARPGGGRQRQAPLAATPAGLLVEARRPGSGRAPQCARYLLGGWMTAAHPNTARPQSGRGEPGGRLIREGSQAPRGARQLLGSCWATDDHDASESRTVHSAHREHAERRVVGSKRGASSDTRGEGNPRRGKGGEGGGGTVRRLRLDAVAGGGLQDGGHQSQRAVALGNDVRLHVPVVVPAPAPGLRLSNVPPPPPPLTPTFPSGTGAPDGRCRPPTLTPRTRAHTLLHGCR